MAAAGPYRQGPEAKLKGWHVLLIMLAFFGVMFAVNGIFVWSAVKSFPGEDVEKSYLQGLDYNSTIEARRAQAALGWTVRAGVAGAAQDQLIVEVETEDGAAVSLLDVTATLRRPATTVADVPVTLSADPDMRGRYVAALPSLAPGMWEILIEARSERTETVLNARKTVVLQ